VELHLQASIELSFVAFSPVGIKFTHVSQQLTRHGFVIIFTVHLTTQEETEITCLEYLYVSCTNILVDGIKLSLGTSICYARMLG